MGVKRAIRQFMAVVGITVVVLTGLATAGQAAVGALIPAANRIDMVYDDQRDLVYITNGSQVLRYDVGTATLLPPFDCGGLANLRGIDLSPDGDTLIACDNNAVGVYVIDLVSGTIRQQLFAPAFYEVGTWAVAFGNDGGALITSRFGGSGSVPMRWYDPKTNAYRVVASVRQDTMVSANADGSVIGFAESNSSDGPWGRYRVVDGDVVRRQGYADGTSASNFEIGVGRDAMQYTLPTYFGAYVYNSSYQRIGTIGTYARSLPIGLAYHPLEDIVYFSWWQSGSPGSTLVKAYRTSDFSLVAEYDFGYRFNWIGNHAFSEGRLRIARDGSHLLCTVGAASGFSVWRRQSAPTISPWRWRRTAPPRSHCGPAAASPVPLPT